MIRSSSKLITKARSLRNISKSGYRFRYSLRFESVNKLTVGGKVVVVWERGQKVVATEAVRVDTATRVVKFDNKAVLAQDVTLFKKNDKTKDFDDKVYRISIKSGGQDGKTVGKIQLDFARYAGIPSGSRRIGAQMSHGGVLIMQIESRFLGEAVSRRKKKKNSQDSRSSKDAVSSVASFVTDNESTVSEDVANVAELDELELDDFGDLSLDDKQDTPTEPRGPRSKGSFKGAQNVGASSVFDSEPMNPSIRKKPKSTNAAVSSNAPTTTSKGFSGVKGPSPPSRGTETLFKPTDSEGSTVSNAIVQRSRIAGGQRAALNRVRRTREGESELEVLRQENERLRRRNEELEEAAHSGGHVDKYTLSKLADENKRLRNEVNELKIQIAREPAYNDVVRDLKEAKMALALLNLEKEELHHQVNASNRRRCLHLAK